jgi:hypothetical protein
MCLEYDGSQIKDVPSFCWTSLIKPGLLYLCCGYASCFNLDFWLDNLRSMLHWFTHVLKYFIGDNKDYYINWNMENHLGK